MTMNRHTISWVSLTLLAALLILSGCKGRQAVTGRTLPPVPTDRIVENILAAQPQFHTMNISKADISLHYGNYDFTFRSSVKMVRDSIIAVSIQPAIGIEMFRIMDSTNELQDKLHANTDYFVKRMLEAGFDIKPTQSAICAVMLYDAKLSQEVAARLQEEGIYVTGFYYPVVPKGEARIRVQISAAHEREHLDKCVAAFTKVGKELGVIK